jgi:hypothetical protein
MLVYIKKFLESFSLLGGDMKTELLGNTGILLVAESDAEQMFLNELHKTVNEGQRARASVFRRAVGPHRTGILGRIIEVFRSRKALWNEWDSIQQKVSTAYFHDCTLVLHIK